jgi:hypothetical protein
MKPVSVDHAYNGEEPLTDHSRWRLREEIGGIGDHVWEYLPEAAAKSKPQTNMTKYWLGIPLVSSAPPYVHTYRPFHCARDARERAPHFIRGDWGILSCPELPSPKCFLFLQAWEPEPISQRLGGFSPILYRRIYSEQRIEQHPPESPLTSKSQDPHGSREERIQILQESPESRRALAWRIWRTTLPAAWPGYWNVCHGAGFHARAEGRDYSLFI